MNAEKWFSAKLRFAVLIEPAGLCRYSDSVFVFKSTEFEAAFLKALQIGREEEEEYLNGDGDRVRWSLASVVSLDILRGALDGAEVYSEPVSANGDRLPFDHEFHPEQSTPTQTI